MAEEQKPTLFGRSLVGFGLTTVIAAALPLAFSGAVQLGAWLGVVTATASTALALLLLRLSLPKGTKAVLSALVATFLVRMLLVAAGLLLALAAGADVLGFAAGFFALYLAHQVLEIVVVNRSVRARAAEGNA